ncbi:glycosyltransferase family 2 protein [Hydrocarboniphaga effusa]|uniref:glycosyltransferase family 2 protein n=1 Tax=Hydrocarboniphaga effusa TaxID=243629 RepID=UPI000A01B30B|nr:glycosyltransferase family 2 protein [Hydrocarboniphaga effusa]
MSSGAIIVTYNPDNSVHALVQALSGQVHKVVVVDNTPGSQRLSLLGVHANIKVVANGNNRGIATALNQGMEELRKSGCDWCFFFDQDSIVPENYVSEMLAFAARCRLREKFMIAPDFVDRNSGTPARFTRLTSGLPVTATCRLDAQDGELISTFAITSGAGLRLRDYGVIGPFRDDFFIDFVDSEYCLRAWKLGFKVAVHCGMCISHAIGERSVKKFLGLTIKPNNHRALRRYYIIRNGTRLIVENIGSPMLVGFFLARFAHEALSMIYEDKRGKKLYAMSVGLWDGLLGNMGQCVPKRVSSFE